VPFRSRAPTRPSISVARFGLFPWAGLELELAMALRGSNEERLPREILNESEDAVAGTGRTVPSGLGQGENIAPVESVGNLGQLAPPLRVTNTPP